MQRYNNFLKLQYFFLKKIIKLTFFDVYQCFVYEHKHLLTHHQGLLTQRQHWMLQKENVPKNAVCTAILGTPIYFPIYNLRRKIPIYKLRYKT